MKYRLLCIDMDGTLLDDNKNIAKKTVDAIRKASRMGIKIALVTGRMPDVSDPAVKILQVPCILACNAGTYILENGQCISEENLSLETMQSIYQVTEKYGVPLWILRRRERFVTKIDAYVKTEMELVHLKPEVVSVEELSARWAEEKAGPNKVLAGAAPEVIKKIQAQIRAERKEVDAACSAESYLEIFPKGMDKGKALGIICRKLGIKKEETIAFGDEELDIPMIEAAGTGVAMGNAIEALKAKADFVTKTNNEAGIAAALEYYLER